MKKTYRLQPTRHPIHRKPYRIKRKKSIFRNRFFWLGFLTLLIAGTIFYFLFFSQTFQVEKIIVTGEKKVATKDIQLVVEKKLENKILFFKTKSIFLINLNEIRKDILNSFPQIAVVEIRRGFPDALYILVVERLKLAIWCQEDRCFLLDNEGVIFEEAQLEGDLPKIVDQQNTTSFTLGEKVIEKDYLEKILKIHRELSEGFEIKIAGQEFIISPDRLTAKTAEGWEIYFDPKGDLNWQLTEFNLILEERIPLEKRKNVEYIDLRFEKVYIFPESYRK